jgi:LPXTG-motif cell wall-anchored protein
MSKIFLTGIVLAVVTLLTPAAASGVTYDKLANLTFSAPVQVPGVTLSAGTYRFHLTNPESSRNVLQVLSNDGSIVYAMFHTIPDNRTLLTEEAVVTFRETPAGIPPALRSLFYGSEHRGYEFVYPKGGPNMIAEVARQPEVTYTPIPVAPTDAPAVALELRAAAEPVGQEPGFAEPVPAPPELPKTATPMPLVAVGGLASLLAGLGLRRLRRRAG